MFFISYIKFIIISQFSLLNDRNRYEIIPFYVQSLFKCLYPIIQLYTLAHSKVLLKEKMENHEALLNQKQILLKYQYFKPVSLIA